MPLIPMLYIEMLFGDSAPVMSSRAVKPSCPSAARAPGWGPSFRYCTDAPGKKRFQKLAPDRESQELVNYKPFSLAGGARYRDFIGTGKPLFSIYPR
jgi:hypothetical protein